MVASRACQGVVDSVDNATVLSTTELGYTDGVTAGQALAGKALVLDSSGTVSFAAGGSTIERAFDFGAMTVGTTTDGVLMRAGTGIGSSGLAFGTASQRAIALYCRPTAATGTFTGIRLRAIADPSSGSTLNIDNFLCQTSVIANKNAATINTGFFEIIPKGTNTIGTARGILINVDSAASVTYTTLIGQHIRFHTRGDETITNDYMLEIENEAVGGNGREVTCGIKLHDTNISGGIIGYTAGIVWSGSFQRCMDIQPTIGTTTDGAVMRVGAGIGTSGLAFGTASQRAFAFYLRPTATSGTFTGMRLRCIADPASGAVSIDNLLCQTSVVASKNATTINSGFFEIIPKGTNTIGTARCILTNVDSAASVTYSSGLINTHLRMHTRGDETMSGVDEMLRIENEAVGGNGRQMDSFIRCMETNMSGGTKAAAYLIDAGTSTSLLATALFRFPDDEVTAWDTATGTGDTEAGALKVVVGSATRYIQLFSDAPA